MRHKLAIIAGSKQYCGIINNGIAHISLTNTGIDITRPTVGLGLLQHRPTYIFFIYRTVNTTRMYYSAVIQLIKTHLYIVIHRKANQRK